MSIKPGRLQAGDCVGIIAPASPPDQESLQRSLSFLEGLGLKVKMGRYVKKEYGYLAGADAERLEDLHEMFLDDEVKAVICAGGGYGTARIASEIDYSIIKAHPKIFWGYSDITFLHTAIYQETGLVTFHGPMLASDIGKQDVHQDSKASFEQLFNGEGFVYSEQISRLETLVEGKAEGLFCGGNLSLMASSIGTPFEIDTKDKIVLIEDINEEPRAVDSMLNQLYMAGRLTGAAGFVIGNFNNCVSERKLSLSLDEVLDHYFKLAGKPCLKGFLIGHCSPHYAVPLGVHALLDTRDKSVAFESGVS
ncbi:LD-carboxypeptidase [Peribacillus sp. SCS-37]|uniref:S66 peptidase family protein n=1 Tax=Paraperibacillus esterisolvens TaxID=3115296 RepID=UPI003906A859